MVVWLFFVFGLIIGSFLNVVIRRLPLDESVVVGRSRCPHCRHTIYWHDNIPLLSFLWLRGRCRYCRKPIAWRYPLVEFLTGLLFAGLSWRWQAQVPWAVASAAASAALLAIAFIDWDTFLIPDVLSLGLLGAGLSVSFWNPYFDDGSVVWHLLNSLIGAAVGFSICAGVALLGEWIFHKEAMGGGDIKLLAAVGAWTGAQGAVDCLIFASLLGALYGFSLILKGKLKRQDPIPFGPFLSAVAIFNFFYLFPFAILLR